MSEKIAVVTGASRGIGREIALRLARDGAKIVVASNEKEGNEAVAAEIEAAGGQAVTQYLNLLEPDSVPGAFKEIADKAGPVSILINNAGITKDNLSMRMKLADWNLVLQINLTGAFVCAQQVMQPMMKLRWGRIVNISSVVGQAGNAGQANYVSSKAGLIGLTKTLAQELGGRNITVNAVAPGFIDTDMTKVLPDEVKQRMLATVPLKRMGTPADIAAAVAFLTSEDAGYITGHVLGVNGGMYM